MSEHPLPGLLINGESIPYAVIAGEVQNHDAPKGKPGLAWRQAAQAVAVRTLLLQEARRRGSDCAPEEVAPGRWETEEEAQVRWLLDQEVNPGPPSQADVRAVYDRDPERFCTAPLWQAAHILCACDHQDPAASQAALERCRQLLSKLQGAPGAFADLARLDSDCSSKANGGALGQLRHGDTVPEFERALNRLAAGQTSADPVRTRFGWHIIRVEAKAAGAQLPFDAVERKIAEALEKAAWAREARDFVATLVADADIKGVDFAPD